ncbi:MAG: diacylglycerol kinase family protein, partial [Ktedonobacterales bacterium]
MPEHDFADPSPSGSTLAAIAPIATAAQTPPSTAAAPLVILNPAANRGHAARLRNQLEQALRDGRGELALTGATGDCARMAREAALTGRGVVVVGGDGT